MSPGTFSPPPGTRSTPKAAFIVFLWLAFSAFPIVDLLASDSSPGHIAVTLALALAYVGTYLFAMLGDRRLPGPYGWNIVLPLAALTATLLAIDGARWTAMLVFTAAAAGRRLQADAAVRVIAVLALGAGGVTLLDDHDTGAALVVMLTTIGIGYWALAFTRTLIQNEQLREAQAEIGRLAVADERLRFARDLHDLLGHSLSVIALKSELAGRLLPDHPDEAAGHVADIEATTRRALAEVREAVGAYRRPVLAEELDGARDALADAGIRVDVDADADALGALPADAEAVLAWAVREGTTNALRHAAARHVAIRLRAGADEASVEVLDDGRGLNGADADGGTGLAGLAERVARARGRMEAAPADGGGFRLSVAVPLEVAR